MDKDLMIYFDEEGVAKAYDDTYDITIHCESEEEQRKAIELIKSTQRKPDEEIQKIQDLEQAQFDKMYELGYQAGRAAQPERQKGEWIDYTEDGYVECPFCHNATNCDGNKDELHFCFSCGADMREVSE